MQGLSYGVIRVDSEERLSVLTVQDVGTVMPGGTHMYMHKWFWESLECAYVNIVVCLALKKSHQRRALCNVYASLSVCCIYCFIKCVICLLMLCMCSSDVCGQTRGSSSAVPNRWDRRAVCVFHRHGNVILWAFGHDKKHLWGLCLLRARSIWL